MQQPETRAIHQCTYTPIERPQKDEVFVPQQPWLKKALLHTVFSEPQIGGLVLQRMADLQRDPSQQPLPDFELLTASINKVWSGDGLSTVSALRDIDIETVICFAREGLETEKSLLEKATLDVEASKSALAKRVDADTELRRNMDSLRESIVSEVRGIVAPLMAERVPPSNTNTVSEGGPTALEATSLVVSGAPTPTSPVSAGQTASPAITSEMLRVDLAKSAPHSAAYLEAIGYFPPALSPFKLPVAQAALAANALILTSKIQTFETLLKHWKIEPMGYLHLERLEFTPLDYVRGELVYSLPMLPRETVRLTHRDWSRTESEYSKLVATELETATEEAISEKSELTQASNTQQQHSSAYNASVNASYGTGGFNISTSFGYNCNNSESSSRQTASKQAQDITKKASSRAKKDSKITFKVTTTYEIEEQSYREIKNDLPRAVRYDFHRLMKEWRIDLYRYDVRLTYDIVIPEPGYYLLRKYIQLKRMDDALARPNPFSLAPSSITKGTANTTGPTDWDVLEKQYGAVLTPPPKESIPLTVSAEVKLAQQYEGRACLEIALPEGYEFQQWHGRGQDKKDLVKHDDTLWEESVGRIDPLQYHNTTRLEAGLKHSNRFLWEYEYQWYGNAKEGLSMTITVDVWAKPSDEKIKEWQTECYERLVEAARLQYENEHERLKQQRERLSDELKREDALVLRKIEKEELMKGVLRWLVGPDFELYPSDKLKLPPSLGLNPEGQLEFYDQSTQSVKTEYWLPTLRYGEMIKFLHQAIEWENVNYVLYPYFWTDPDKERWDFKQSLYHDDYVHRSFLRAGASRVVLTVRPGFEKDFLSFMEGSLDHILEGDHQYMTVADELKAMAMTKYPYTQDANVEKEEFLFTWEDVGKNGPDNNALLDYLERKQFVNWSYLFSIGSEFANELDDSQITPALRDKFQEHGNALPQQDVQVAIEAPEGRWQLTIAGAPGYCICRDNQALNVYDLRQENRPTPVKSADGNTISFAKGHEAVKITKNDAEGTARINTSNGRTLDLTAKDEEGQHKLYGKLNWVDTWYEFTPTGALDVEVGNISPNLIDIPPA